MTSSEEALSNAATEPCDSVHVSSVRIVTGKERSVEPEKNAAVGFTLIELTVVVTIISIVAAVILPALFGRADEAREKAMAQTAAAQGQSDMALSPERWPQEDMAGVPPNLESAEIEVDLVATHHLVGMDVTTRYDSEFRGHFKFSVDGEKSEGILIGFPFPTQTTEAKDVSLSVVGPGGQATEPEGVHYTRYGIWWQPPSFDGGTLEAEVTYSAQGRDRFGYRLPGRGRAREVKLTLNLEGAAWESIPDAALQPTEVSPNRMVWEFKNLVTDRPIVVDLPAAMSPMGRIILLCKLVGVAVLIFGAGVWYLSELREAGMLAQFRMGHFLLLAATYSLFFVIFATLGFISPMSPVLLTLISGVLSLPLLALHLTRFMEVRFAVTRILPLAIFSLALVVLGVYAGRARGYVFIAGTVATVAFITVTFPPFYSNWVARIKEEARFAGRRTIEGEAKLALVQLAERCNEVGVAATCRADAVLSGEEAEEASPERLAVAETRERLSRLMGERQGLTQCLEKLSGIADDEVHGREAYALKFNAEKCVRLLEGLAAELEERLRRLTDRQEREGDPASRKRREAYCLACGKTGDPTPYCAHCGVQRPITFTCDRCGEPFRLPVHLMAKEAAQAPLFCMACGAKHAWPPDSSSG